MSEPAIMLKAIMGQRVELACSSLKPRLQGTITRVDCDGSFRVSYDSGWGADGRRVRGGRYCYPARAASAFLLA